MHIKFQAELSEVGLEILQDLQETKNFDLTAQRLDFYPFLEVIANHYKPSLFQFPDLEDKVWRFDCESKINIRLVDTLEMILPFFISKDVEFYYWDEWISGGKPKITIIHPREPIIDYYHRYGEPTGITL